MLNQGLFSGDSVYYVAYLAVMSVLLVLVFTLALSTGTIERAFDVMLAKQERQAVERLSQRAAEGQTPNESTAKTEEAHAFEEAPGALFDRRMHDARFGGEVDGARDGGARFARARQNRSGTLPTSWSSRRTQAKGYVKNVYAKLGIHSRQEAHRRGRGALSADVVAAGLMTFCAREVPPHAGHAPAPAGTSAPQLLHTTATLIENIPHLLQCVRCSTT